MRKQLLDQDEAGDQATQSRFMTPTANSSGMSAQQQPRQ